MAGTYSFQADGEWMDSGVRAGPGGTSRGEFHVGKLAHVIGTILGYFERLYRWFGTNRHADLPGTRRHEEWSWFALVGTVANATSRPETDGTPPPHCTFLIGERNVVRVAAPGYLYAYANDAWRFYFNNRGSLRLTVTRDG